MDSLVYLALGANLGAREANLRAARLALSPLVTVRAASPMYRTPPWGFTEQPEFLNQVLEATTGLSPAELLSHLKAIERSLGRAETFRYGPRLIDLDILFYDDLVTEEPGLTIPHPRLQERAFVLVPLADLAADLCHPVLGLTVAEMLARVDTTGVLPHEIPEDGLE
jgi:2-amino-4-hydroxy-6-hydroxymethyldihydropteridine diphosphokinase